MKTTDSSAHRFDRTTFAFIAVLITAGTVLLLGSRVGVLSLESTAKFWPLTIVAAGLVELLDWRGDTQA